jgi:predicted ATP-grasp superfamily ATP-dependent carboligase
VKLPNDGPKSTRQRRVASCFEAANPIQMTIPHLLIVGASVRAAAQSARRAGYCPLAIDQFGDKDLDSICQTQRVLNYPYGIVEAAREFPQCPFLYTGALENHPEIIANLQRERPLLGNSPDVLRAVRDPRKLRHALEDHGFHFPEIWEGGGPIPRGDWLKKPVLSGGGIGVQRVVSNGQLLTDFTPQKKPHIVQRLIHGEPVSALFAAAAGQAVLLGSTRQLIGCHWAGADKFLYVGTIGPLTVPVVIDRFIGVGNHLAREFRLTGIFGVDAILRNDELWILEVNPRYTSAVEILERASELPAIRLHVDACRESHLPKFDSLLNRGLHGKAILYSRRELTATRQFSDWVNRLNSESEQSIVADLPRDGSTIKRGQPICTVFASGDTAADVESSLQKLGESAFESLGVRR